MGLSEYYKSVRAKFGNQLLFAPGVCALVFNDANEILLQKRSDTGNWGVLGGMIDPGEEPADTVVREVLEETSIKVKPIRISGVYSTPMIEYPNGDRAQYIITAFVCQHLEGVPKVNDVESLEIRYFPITALPELRSNHRVRIKQAMANLPAAIFHLSDA